MVASRIGGCLDLVRPSESGLLVDPDYPGALAAQILRLFRDPDLRARLQQTARRQVVREHTIAVVATAYSALYERLTRT